MRRLALPAILALVLASCYPTDCPQGITPLAVTHDDSVSASFLCHEQNFRTHLHELDSAQRARLKR